MNYTIRKIAEKDDRQVENLIRTCLIEFGGNKSGTAWTDPDLSRFSQVYNNENDVYFVAVDENDNVIAGSGIGKIDGLEGVCELQKMYCNKHYRKMGIANELLKRCLDFAKSHYDKCYLETLSNMLSAQRFYEKNGFKKLEEPLLKTAHFACDVRYIKDLK